MIDPRESGIFLGGPGTEPMRPQGEVSLSDQFDMPWGKLARKPMDPKKKALKALIDALLLKMATPDFQHPPAFQPSDPFRYYPQ